MEMFAEAINSAQSAEPYPVAFALENVKGRSAHGEVIMRKLDHQAHFDMVISHVSKDVEKPFIYNGENYELAYETDGWIDKDDLTLESSCQMKRPSN